MPGLIQRASAAVKAFRLQFPGSGRGGQAAAFGYLYGWPRFDQLSDPSWGGPRGGYDVHGSAGVAAHNSAVAICVSCITRNFPEPKLEVAQPKGDGSDYEPVHDHPLTRLLNEPNPVDDFESLAGAVVADYCVDGNGYLLKVRNQARNRTVELEWLPSFMVEPRSNDKYQALTHYEYRIDGRVDIIPADRIIHLRLGKDPGNPRKGCSPLKHIIYELAADNEASLYTAAILHNMGIVGGMITNEDPEVELTPEAALDLRDKFKSRFTGTSRGDILVPNFKAKWQDVGRSPEEMALDKIRQVPEARICASLRVPAMVAGLSVGDTQKTYSNYAESREAFYEDCLIPIQRRFAAALTRFLLPEYEAPGNGVLVRWNYDNVRVLQPDLDKLTDRVGKAYKVYQLLTLNQALAKLGEKPVDGPEGEERYQEPAAVEPNQGPENEGEDGAEDETGPTVS